MLFEGSEKKVEVAVLESSQSLRGFPKTFWESVVSQSQARVLSVLSSDECDAYLLSESSLFVWDHYFTMITCGQTQLVNAVLSFAEQVGVANIASLIFERKNEYFPRHQKSDFFEDLKRLRSALGGLAYRFGNVDDHHLYLYNLDKSFRPTDNDYTVEVLMYDLQGQAKSVFGSGGLSAEQIRDATQVDKILPGFEVDDHVFEPRGYSLNALRGADYYTIHVTPEETGSYVSFESNIKEPEAFPPLVERVLETFQPNSYDVVLFSPRPLAFSFSAESFFQRAEVEQELTCGYWVRFSSHFKKTKTVQPATPIPL